jgi:hypothetical protein
MKEQAGRYLGMEDKEWVNAHGHVAQSQYSRTRRQEEGERGRRGR